jgi:hypothetical protein
MRAPRRSADDLEATFAEPVRLGRERGGVRTLRTDGAVEGGSGGKSCRYGCTVTTCGVVQSLRESSRLVPAIRCGLLLGCLLAGGIQEASSLTPSLTRAIPRGDVSRPLALGGPAKDRPTNELVRQNDVERSEPSAPPRFDRIVGEPSCCVDGLRQGLADDAARNV